ncbi:hypothetical protein ACVWW6_008807 [Bradyrhizobium sp. USDA 3311]
MQKNWFGATGMRRHKRIYVKTDRLKEPADSALIRFKRCLVRAWTSYCRENDRLELGSWRH